MAARHQAATLNLRASGSALPMNISLGLIQHYHLHFLVRMTQNFGLLGHYAARLSDHRVFRISSFTPRPCTTSADMNTTIQIMRLAQNLRAGKAASKTASKPFPMDKLPADLLPLIIDIVVKSYLGHSRQLCDNLGKILRLRLVCRT